MSSFRAPSILSQSRSRASRSSSPPPKADAEKSTLDDIIAMWRRTVEGLYKAHPKTSFYFLDELRALCRGAGLDIDPETPNSKPQEASPKSPLWPLEQALDYVHYGYKNNLLSLKLEMHTPERLREELHELLRAYCFEAGSLDDIEEQLRRKQIGLREPSRDNWLDTWEVIESDVLATGRKLKHYHTRLQLWQYEVEKEALVNRSEDKLQWVYISELAYPVRHSRTSSAGANSFHA